MYGDAPPSIDDFAFTSVQAGPNVDTELAHGIGNCAGAADRPCWTVERSEEAVPGSVELLALEASELTANQRVVAVEQLAPGCVAELSRRFRRTDDVGEEDGQDAIGFDEVPLAALPDLGEEALDFARYRFWLREPRVTCA